MNDAQNTKKLLLPAVKGLPWIIASVVVALLFASRILYYATPRYESTALLRLDDKNDGVSDKNLFKDFDVFTANNKIATEEQLIRSQVLITKALKLVDFNTSLYRVGDIRKTELYKNSPLSISCIVKDSSIIDQRIGLTVTGKKRFELHYSSGKKDTVLKGELGKPVISDVALFNIKLNEEVIAGFPEIKVDDQFEFILRSNQSLFESVITPHLDVKSIDKDIPVLRITYSSEVPQKAADFANAIAEAYIRDYVESKTEAASKTVQFIDERLETIGKDLRESELRLEEYRLKNRIVNTRQETETGLRQVSDLQMQLTSLDMQDAALQDLADYVNSKSDFNDVSPAFEAINDVLFSEMIRNLKTYQQERRELLTRYTPESEKVKLVESKIGDIVGYCREAITNARKNIESKRRQLSEAVFKAEHSFDNLPTKEKNLINLERDFQLNQKVYQFLLEKRTEASIAESATVSFHRVIQPATVSKMPVYPKRGFMMILAGFTGLLVSVVSIYLRRFFRGKIEDKESVEKLTTLPVMGILHETRVKEESRQEFSNLTAQLLLMEKIKKHSLITVASTISGEGKSYVTEGLAGGLGRSGRRVLVMDMNLHQRNSGLGITDVVENGVPVMTVINKVERGLYDRIEVGSASKDAALFFQSPALFSLLDDLRQRYDVVLLDVGATSYAIDAISMMKNSSLNLYVVRSGYTSSYTMSYPEMLMSQYGLAETCIILNGMHNAVNYNGDFTGSTFTYHAPQSGWRPRFSHYLKTYIR